METIGSDPVAEIVVNVRVVRSELAVHSASNTASVHGDSLHGTEVDVGQASDVDGRCFCPVGSSTRCEGRATTSLAEVMADHVLVEQVRRIFAFTGPQMKALARDKPEQVTFSTAMGAIALLYVGKVAIDFKSDASAVTATLVHFSSFVCDRLLGPRAFRSPP
jgi:hypothetical protein